MKGSEGKGRTRGDDCKEGRLEGRKVGRKGKKTQEESAKQPLGTVR